MPPRPRSGPRPYPGGQFNDPEHLPDPSRPGKAAQARRALAAGPPEGFPPTAEDQGGPKPSAPAEPTRRVPPVGQMLGGGGSQWSDGGGFMLGLLLYVLGLNYLRHGPAGVKAWFMAKLFNKVTQFPSDPVPGSISKHGITA